MMSHKDVYVQKERFLATSNFIKTSPNRVDGVEWRGVGGFAGRGGVEPTSAPVDKNAFYMWN